MIAINDPHADLHSEHGAVPGEHPGRAANPIVKVYDLAWLEFEKPDLERTERFAAAFGFSTALRTADQLHLRGSDPGAPCVLVRKAARSRFVGPSFRAADSGDVTRLAKATGAKVEQLPETLGGRAVTLIDPNGMPVRLVADPHELPAMADPTPLTFSNGSDGGSRHDRRHGYPRHGERVGQPDPGGSANAGRHAARTRLPRHPRPGHVAWR